MRQVVGGSLRYQGHGSMKRPFPPALAEKYAAPEIPAEVRALLERPVRAGRQAAKTAQHRGLQWATAGARCDEVVAALEALLP